MLFQLSLLLPSLRDFRGPFSANSDPAVPFGFAESDPTVPFGFLVLPFFLPCFLPRPETQAHLSTGLPVELLRPYGLVFPFAHAERSWMWILLELSPHVIGARKKAANFRRSRACHDSLLQPALSPRNPVVGVHIEGLAQLVALHNRLSRPVGHLHMLI